MSKYIKSNSTFTLRKKIQDVNDGSIFERDWTTLEGQKLRFGKGKTPIYTDGNFVFTTANISMPSRRSKPNTSQETYTYDDVKDAKSYVNNVELNINTNNIRDFVYYGSCVNLVETSITNIISNFPACIYTSDNKLEYLTDDEEFKNVTDENEDELFILNNPFNIDLLTKSINNTEVYNVYRYICETYDKYEINGVKINGYDVDYVFSECKDDDQWYNFIIYRIKSERLAPIIIRFYLENNTEVVILGYRYNKDIVFLTKDNITIKPQNDIIEDYFKNLKGFEKVLLTRETKPLYTSTFLTPFDTGQEYYKYVNKQYSWSVVCDYCLDITSPAYNTYVNDLLSMASIYDEIWTNNLYNRMTHEAIKNFDWTFSQHFIDGEEQDNIDGGLRMQQILFLIGRIFDDVKAYINGIKNSNKVTYDGISNLPDALLSNKAEVLGWDVTSVIPSKNVITLDNKFINDRNLKWFDSVEISKSNSTLMDVNFMRNLILSSKRIFSSKGTQESIDMIMGIFGFGRDDNSNGDYKIFEKSYKATLRTENVDELIEKINEVNINRINFDDPYNTELFNGLPLNILEIEKNKYVIPYYDNSKSYYHDLYFQSKGGWGKLDNSDYCETISYLNVVSTFGSLLDVSSLDVKDGDIYYVIDLSDYPTYKKQEISINTSHFFYYEGITTSVASSWKNIDQDKIKKDTNDDYAKKAYYLNEIVNTKFGNNPHVGYGLYDDGETFKNYINQPFKYHLDNGYMGNDSDIEFAKKFKFDIKESTEDKFLTFNELKKDLANGNYRLNTKIVIIENNHKNNEFYKNYFRTCMLPYLMQVIPSTTILILKDF